MKLTPEELHILQHSLGVDKHGQGEQYRNHFCTGPGCDDFDRCTKLVAAGFMQTRGAVEVFGGLHTFTVTPGGIDAVALQSPVPPKLPRSKQRYRAWLRSDCGLSFGDWLRDLKFRKEDSYAY